MTAPATGRAPIPGPPPVPVLGARGNFLRFIRDPVGHMRFLHRTHGDVVALARGSAEHIFVFAPEYNNLVLGDTALFHARDASNFPVRIPAGSALARLFSGLTQMNGARHEQQRRLMRPAFHHKRLAAYRDDVVALTRRHLAGWEVGQRRDLLREMRELTFALAVKTRLGLDPAADGRETGRLLDEWLGMVFSLPALLLPAPLPGLPYRRLLRLSESLEREIRGLVKRKREGGGDGHDLLSMLIAARDEDGTRLTDEELVGQTATLFVAGNDITARALTWTLLLLALHPRIAAEVRDELAGRLGGRAPRFEELNELPLLEWTIKESLRLLPPVLWWSRVSTAPCTLGGYDLPRGATVIVSHFVTHRRPELYDDPDRFKPSRWRHHHPGPYEFIPFSAGPRVCLGAAVAMTEMKLILSVLLQRYHPGLPAGASVDLGGLMLSAPKRGLPATLCRPGGRFERPDVRGNILNLISF